MLSWFTPMPKQQPNGKTSRRGLPLVLPRPFAGRPNIHGHGLLQAFEVRKRGLRSLRPQLPLGLCLAKQFASGDFEGQSWHVLSLRLSIGSAMARLMATLVMCFNPHGRDGPLCRRRRRKWLLQGGARDRPLNAAVMWNTENPAGFLSRQPDRTTKVPSGNRSRCPLDFVPCLFLA